MSVRLLVVLAAAAAVDDDDESHQCSSTVRQLNSISYFHVEESFLNDHGTAYYQLTYYGPFATY